MCKRYPCVPDFLLTKFEVSRLVFTKHGTLQGLNGKNYVMERLLYGTWVLKLITMMLLGNAYQHLGISTPNPVSHSNLKMIASIIYEVFASEIRKNIPKRKDSNYDKGPWCQSLGPSFKPTILIKTPKWDAPIPPKKSSGLGTISASKNLPRHPEEYFRRPCDL